MTMQSNIPYDNTPETCEVYSCNQSKVQALQNELTVTQGLVDIFRALGDETRLKIIYALTKEELCVCDIAALINSSVQAASHHLRLLKNMGLATSRKEGKMVFYSLESPIMAELIQTMVTYVKGGKKYGR